MRFPLFSQRNPSDPGKPIGINLVALKRAAIIAAFDLVVLFAFALVAFGFYLAWRPLGFIVGGLLLAGAAFLASPNVMRRVRPDPTKPSIRG